ncbi:MAG: hypothetical protein WD971_14675, partial [Pirellulales bacterium]
YATAAEHAAADQEYRARREQSTTAQQELAGLRASLERQRAEHMEAVRNASLLANQVTVLDSRLVAARADREKCRQRLDELHEQRDTLAAKLAQLQRQETAAQTQFDACQTERLAGEGRLAALQREIVRVDKQHRQLESQLTRTRERIDVLTELHERLEGLNSGVREVLLAAQHEPDGPYGEVRGVVADLFHVDVDSAPLVDVALGEFSQYVVVTSAGRLFDWLNEQPLRVTGRVGFLRLDGVQRRGEAAPVADLSSEAGVMGRADKFVETASELMPLSERLLGRTWFVDRLSTALRLAQTAGRGLAFVTGDGELLAADGTLVVGPRQASAGLLSRRSELRACHEQLAELEQQLAHQQVVHARLEDDRAGEEQRCAARAAKTAELAAELAEHRQRTAAARGQHEQASHAAHRVERELLNIQEQCAVNEYEVESTREQQSVAAKAAALLETEQVTSSARLQVIEEILATLQAATTEKRIAAAKCEQRVEMLRAQLEQAH